jgi:uncharacterized protein involved in exopolysaccharide biosynthesis
MSSESQLENPRPQDDEIDLVELFLILWNRKFFIVGLSGFITVLVALHQLYIAVEIFKSDAKILPIKSSGSSGMLAQLGGLASFVGVEAPKSENTTELIMKSRSFAQKVVEEFDLSTRWECTFQEAVKSIQDGALTVEVSKKDPLITVAWEDKDPEFAQRVVTRVLEMAQTEMANHAANQKLDQVTFLEGRVTDAKKEMTRAEDELQAFQEQHEGVQIEKQAEALIAQIQMLKADQQAKEVQLQVSKRMLNAESREVKMLDMTVGELQSKVDELVGEAQSDASQLGTDMDERSLMEIPKIGLAYARKMREVKVTQKIYGMLLEQLEMAKIEAHKDVESFEVIDPPLVPERRIKPKRSLTVAIAGVCSGMLAVMLVLLQHFIANIRQQRATA